MRAVLEPAFWLGQPRTNVGAFVDYFDTLIGWERFRAEQFGIHHFCTMGLNPREANDDRVNDAVLEVLPRYLEKDGVVGVGEIGLDDQTKKEEKFFLAQLELAQAHDLPVAHPHAAPRQEAGLRALHRDPDPRRELPDARACSSTTATRRRSRSRATSAAVSGFSLYPNTKMDVDPHGRDRAGVTASSGIVVNSAADWGISDPLMVPRLVQALLRSGFPAADVQRLVCDNPVGFFAQSGRLDPKRLERPPMVSRRETHDGNTILRGQDPDKV